MLQSYIQLARLHRPQAISLLMLPGWWGITAASSDQADFYMLFLFCMGAILMRSAGCVYNDMVDSSIDRRVERTRLRPLARGTLSHRQATVFFLALLSFSGCILVLMPLLTIWLGVASIALVMIYPWMKRITYWPQAFLGLTFNWGALMGWSAIRETIELPALLLYVGGFFWTLIYDTFYAHQDKYDDLVLGVGSTALRFAKSPYLFLSAPAFLSVICFIGAGVSLKLSWLYYLSIAGVGFHYLWQISTADFENTQDCAKKFIANAWVGWVLLAGLVLGKLNY